MSASGCNAQSVANVCTISDVQNGEAMQVVNGYVCRDCSDVALAKKGVDPAQPERERTVAKHPVERRPEPGTVGALAERGDVGTRLHVIA